MTSPSPEPLDSATPLVARLNAVHCCPSGVSDPTYRLNYPVSEQIGEAITASIEVVPELASVEVLAVTGPKTPSVTVHGSRVEAHNTGLGMDGSANPDRAVGDEMLARALEETLPGWYGVERGELILDPIGTAAMSTSRLVTIAREPGIGHLKTGIKSLFELAHSRNVPMIYQVLIQRITAEIYRAIVRIGIVEENPRPLQREQYLKKLHQRPFGTVDEEIADNGLASSQHLASDHWNSDKYEGSGRFATVSELYTDDGTHASAADRRRLELLDGRHEYGALLEGRPGVDPYRSLEASPSLALSPDELDAVLPPSPLYGGCRWPTALERTRPCLARDEVCTEAAGTDHTAVLPHGTDAAVSDRPLESQSLLEFVKSWLEMNGCRPSRADVANWGGPHLRGSPWSETTPVVMADPSANRSERTIDTPAELILAANRATQAGESLLVVTPSRTAARSALRVLAKPYKCRLEGGRSELYQLPEMIRPTKTKAIVARREDGPLQWSIDPQGQRRLANDTGCIAAGPVEVEPSSYDYQTPYVRRDGDGVIVEDGGVEKPYPSLEACATEYRFAGQPVTPLKPLFCGSVTVVYREGAELVDPMIDSRWADPIGDCPPKEHLRRAFEYFLETYTREKRGMGRGATGFRQRFGAWYAPRSATRLYRLVSLERKMPDDVPYRASSFGGSGEVTNRQWWLPTDEDDSTAILDQHRPGTT